MPKHSTQKNNPTNLVKQSKNIQSFGSSASFLLFFDTMTISIIKRSKSFLFTFEIKLCYNWLEMIFFTIFIKYLMPITFQKPYDDEKETPKKIR